MAAIPDDVKLPAIERILEKIAETETPANKVCAANGINYTTFLGWVRCDENLAKRYARALDDQTDIDAFRLLEIADRPSPTTDSGATDSGDVQQRKLQIETRKWIMARRSPKKYGDRVDHSVDGSVTINVNRSGKRGSDD